MSAIDKAKAWSLARKVGYAIVTAAVGALITIGVQTYSGRLRELTYRVIPSSGIINKPDTGAKAFQVLIDGKPVDNISTVQMAIWNLSDTDFDDVPLSVIFAPINGKSPPVIQATIKSSALNISTIQGPTTQPDGSLNYTYKLAVVNRSTTPAFVATYTFDGKDSPSPVIEVRKKGLGMVPVSEVGSKDYIQIIQLVLNVVLGATLVFFTFRVTSLTKRMSSRIDELHSKIMKAIGIQKSVFNDCISLSDSMREGESLENFTIRFGNIISQVVQVLQVMTGSHPESAETTDSTPSTKK